MKRVRGPLLSPNQDGQVTILNPDWSQPAVQASSYNWGYLYHGMRAESFLFVTANEGGGSAGDRFFYLGSAGSQWYDPSTGRLLSPTAASFNGSNTYDPTGGATEDMET